ncbi:NADH-ubiquinone oxidoreductase-F iron-sulfur binding region domain-containing protein [Natrialba aegyptia]|uniref:Putative NADH dehydrogenase I, F subunit n=1 Tax=Natrialba aegyptia DSM 13077 TaxID=1227491 RepID=M0AXZ9_9EURY|nr:NADH-ubiquinone oxidoreductase-F iron-sulfur binding region domain-containing protein [Natrialba aegyptia]ELZ02299.1 putative NADH dehydrogenase I, F subunit [Natrialba aegyptia DSM 13077]
MREQRGAIGQSPTVRISSAATPAPEAVLDVARETATDTHVVEVGPVGVPRFDPLAVTTADGTTAFHTAVSPSDVRLLVDTLEEGESPTDGAHAVVSHDPEPATLPRPDSGPLAVGERVALARCGWVAPVSVTDYEYEFSAELVTTTTGSDEAFDRLAEVGLRGRGRGDGSTDDPVAETWTTVREAPGDPVVVVNGNEADENARMDSLLLESVPIDVLDGASVVASALETPDIVVYLDESDTLARERVEQAAGAIDRDVDGVDLNVQVASGPDTYRAGEMTMALESLEGNDRLEARRRPPGPAEYGLFGRPTAIHTPRTLAQVRAALASPEAMETDETDPGTRLLSVAGDVESPATVELPTDGSLKTAFDAVVGDGQFKAACVGGVFGGITRDIRVSPSAGALRSSNLGTNGIVERLNDDRCMVAFAGKRAKFAREGNCGRCVPGREGTKQLLELLREIYDGDYNRGMIEELARVMRRSSICDFGQTASRPTTTAMSNFDSEFTAHTEGYCPAGFCEEQAATERRTEPRRPGSTAHE